METLDQKKERLQKIKVELELHKGLPHLYAFKFYSWARKIWNALDRVILLCAANQISKSSTMIRKTIELAGNPELWPKYWTTAPKQFWYLYPSKEVATIEFEQKWVKEFMPRGEFKKHPTYGWEVIYSNKHVHEIKFNSGVSIYFKTYTQDVQRLQSGTVHLMSCFTEGHLVLTNSGLVPIEKVSIGDFVKTQVGYEKVMRILSNEKEVIKRELSNGESLIGTDNHKVFTFNRGFVELKNLTQEDQLGTVRLWKLQKKLYCLTEKFTRDFQNQKIIVKKITSIVTKVTCMLFFGKSTMVRKFLLAMLSTTRILIRSIIELRIFSFLRGQSILVFTKQKSGSIKESGNSPVLFVKKNSYQEVQRIKFLDTAVRSVEGLLTQKLLHVSNVVKKRLLGKTSRRLYVLPSVEKLGKRKVYNLTVENTHNYFVNGVLVSNCDEELPVYLLDELMFRLSAVDGIFMAAFTATLGQSFWYRAIEKIGTVHEELVDALKLQVSMYDCLLYEDGTATPWTVEKINKVKNKCSTKAQIQRRVYGKFVVDEGLVYKSFNSDRNCVTTEEFKAKNEIKEGLIPKTWEIFSAVDIGSGDENHPAAMTFIAVKPDYTYGVLFKCRRLDDVGTTTSEDVLSNYRALRGDIRCVCQSYDWAAKDFSTYADRVGESFIKAEKSHSIGEDLVNVLFKNQMLDIIVDDPDDETNKYVGELESLRLETDKKHAKDDLCDAARYTVCSIPWDYTKISSEYKEVDEKKPFTVESEIERRRSEMFDDGKGPEESSDEEISFFNELYEG